MKLIARDGKLWDKATGLPYESAPGPISAPHIQSDIPAYASPRGTGMIEGRAARRNDLAAGNCREVDPSEFKVTYQNERFAKKHGLPWTPEGPYVKRIGDDG